MLNPDGMPVTDAKHTVQLWKQLSSQALLDRPPWLKVHEDTISLPGGRVIDDYYRVETPDYVIMAVCNAEGLFLLERMYKHGVGSIILTSPSGGIDAGEEPLHAAQRELIEETGYMAEKWTSCGSFFVDGTRGICKAHFFIARGLKQVDSPEYSDIETCETVFLTQDEVFDAMRDGRICLLPDIALYSLVTSPLMAAVRKDL